MRRIGLWLTVGLLAGILAACGGRGEIATGALQVNVFGLEAGATARIDVVGPEGFVRQLTFAPGQESQTLTGLRVGSYTVGAAPLPGYRSQVSGSPTQVSAGETARVDVAYIETGDPGTGGSISGTVSIVGAAETAAPFAPGEVIVKFRPGFRAQALAGLERLRKLPIDGAGLYRAAGLSAQAGDARLETLRLVARLSTRDDVVYALPNYLLEAFAEPNDPLYDLQWHYEAINLPSAWDRTTGSAGVVVAVLDSGVRPSHPDLSGKLEPGYDFVSSEGFSGDGDGRDGDPTDPEGDFHGSHVAGTVAAATDNGVGVAGVGWDSRILPVRVLGSVSGTLADAIDGILWSVGESVPGVPENPNPADVLNLSLGGPLLCSDVPPLQDAFDRANEAGAVVVVAAGNEGADASDFVPASCGGVIAVGATTLGGELAYYSNYGALVDVVAPGGDLNEDADGNGDPDGVLSTVFDEASGVDDYAYFEGTSMAAPHVAGVVALMKSLRPALSGAEARDILQRTARPITDGSCSVGCGAGLIDAAAALAALSSPAEPDFSLSLSPATVSLSIGDSASVTVSVSRSGGFDGEVSFSISGLPGGLSASFTPSATTADSAQLTLSVAAGLEGEYTLQVQGAGGGISKTVPLGVVIEGDEPDEPDFDIAGSYVFACPVSASTCNVSQVPAVRIETGGSSAPYTIPDVPAGDFYVYGWNDLNDNGQVDNGEPIGVFPSADAPRIVNPPASGVDLVLVPALGTQAPGFEGSVRDR